MAGSREMCAWMHQTLPDALPRFLRAICSPAAGARFSTTDEQNGLPDGLGDLDPEKLEYLRQLILALYEARAVVSCYNILIPISILVFTFLRWQQVRSSRRRWERRINTLSPRGSPVDEASRTVSSSSSSTIQGTATPPDLAKQVSDDMERLPLIPRARTRKSPGAISRAISSWLARQPPPLPIINRTLPSNATSLFVASWVLLNVFFHLYRLPMRWDFFFIFADRAGLIFVVNLPLLYLLSAKNQPLRQLTGYSYEALNIFHRRVGEFMCFEAAVHFVSMVYYQFFLMEEWLKASITPREYWTHPIILFGLGTFVSYEMLFFTSLGSFRQRWYELFLATHVFLQLAAFVFLFFHYPTSRGYVVLALVIFLVDRLVWRFSLKQAEVVADISVLEDGETFLVSADWDIPSQKKKRSHWWWPWDLHDHSILQGWEPTDHIFLTVPALGHSFNLQAHPFTIASAAPGVSPGSDTDPVHAWFSLLVRAYDGFTHELLRYAQTHSRVPIILDGPYGSSHALEMLRASGCAILFAGGSGIAVTFPLVWALLHDNGSRRQDRQTGAKDSSHGKPHGSSQTVHMLWVTHSRSHQNWIPEQQLDSLVSKGLNLVITEPTAEAGRPDVAMYVRGWIDDAAAEGRESDVVVSGPDGLNRAVRNACADALGDGLNVNVAVEKFGW